MQYYTATRVSEHLGLAVLQGESRVTPQQLFPEFFPGPALYPAGWGSNCHSAFFSPMPASLLTSVSSRCAFKFDPRRNFKANFTTGDTYETCHCLCYNSTAKNSGAVFLVTTWLLFLLDWKHMPHRRLQILKMMLLYIYTYEYTRTEYT